MKIPQYLLATLLTLQSLVAQTPARGIDGCWQGALVFGQGKQRVLLYVSPSREGVYSGAIVELASGSALNIDLISYANGKVGLELKRSEERRVGKECRSRGAPSPSTTQ